MPLSILSPHDRRVYAEFPPAIDEHALARYFTLTAQDQKVVWHCRGDHNRWASKAAFLQSSPHLRDAEKFLENQHAVYLETLKRVNPLWPSLDDVWIEDGQLHLSRLKAAIELEGTEALRKRLYALLPRRKLAQIFREVLHWVDYLHPLREAADDDVRLLVNVIAWGQRGEMRLAALQDQLNRASCLRLVASIIILFNAAYLQAGIKKLREAGVEIADQQLAHIFPTASAHIGFLGNYSFQDDPALATEINTLPFQSRPLSSWTLSSFE